ncbi:putative transcription factor AP2-EREBP family [Helianthus annuus]|nr:putative transcription factor AP2-EREBP family [Helianthus annuus]
MDISSASECNSSAGELLLASQIPKKRAGRKKFKETRHPVYRGVRGRNPGKWVCEVREPNKRSRVWLGTYPTAEMAARAHDVAVLAMRGRSACLNFADSVWRLPLPESNNVKDIQKAAAEAAEAFRQTEDAVVGTNEFPEVVVYARPGIGVESGHGSKQVRVKTGQLQKRQTENAMRMNELPEVVVYADEDEIFGMPGYIASMAEGLMVLPPQMVGYANFRDDEDFYVDMSLWSFM